MEDVKAITNWLDHRRPRERFLWVFCCLLAVAMLPSGLHAGEARQSSLSSKFAGLAHEGLEKARKHYEADPKNAERAWRLGKAFFFSGEFATNKVAHLQLAESGIAVSRQALAAKSESPEACYYLAMNQGQLARTKLLGALPLVREMAKNLRTVATTKPKLDFAGPDRSLGLIYRDAPGWPISVGSKKKARVHLRKAFALVPEYPENIIVLLETWIKWKDRKQLKLDLSVGKAVLQEARKKLTGSQWAPFWDDWDRRWHSIRESSRLLLPE